jgi:hypothetical protein
MKMNTIFKCVIAVCFGIVFISALPSAPVEEFVCTGIIKEAKTNKPLSNVRITIDTDSIGVKSDAKGQFKIKVRMNTRLWFRLRGYQWENLNVSDKNAQTIYLSPSDKTKSITTTAPGEVQEVIVDGWRVPKDEWSDININPEALGDLEFKTTKKRIKVILTTN